MKKNNRSIIYLLFVLLFAGFASLTNAQNNCIGEPETRTPWTNIPYLDGDNSYMNIDLPNGNFADWLEGSFSFDMWLYSTWPYNNGDNTYFIFGAGHWDDDHNSMLVYFEQYQSNTYRLRISDGNDDGSNPDLKFNIDYQNDFQQKWVHITVTYDDNTVRLYLNGQYKAGKSFTFDRSLDDFIVVGGHAQNHTEDYRGYISGFRFWQGVKLESSEVAYIYPRTFKGVSSFAADKQHLNDHLKVLMYANSSNIYSIADNNEAGIAERYVSITSSYHPAYPLKPHNLSATRNCDDIILTWENNSFAATTNYIYRKKENESGDGTLLCRTNETTYTDNSTDLEAGQNYVYTIRGVWRNPDDSQDIGSTIYQSKDAATITTSLKKLPYPRNFMVSADANSGQCNGSIDLSWTANEKSVNGYEIGYSTDGGTTWSKLVEIADWQTENYTHALDYQIMASEIHYKIDADADGCSYYDTPIIGVGNETCTTAPTNAEAVVENQSVKVTWDFSQAAAPASKFLVYRKTGTGDYQNITELDINQRQYTDLNAAMCNEYYYKIEASNQCASSNAMSNETSPVTIPSQFDNVFTYTDTDGTHADFDASKGYFNQKTELEWSVNPNKKGDVDTYEIYRRKGGNSYTLLTTIENPNATIYEDRANEANEIYEYKIRATGMCASTELTSDELTTLGFRTSTGIVSGKVTFEGGNAVENVRVVAQSTEAAKGASVFFNDNPFVTDRTFGEMDNLHQSDITVEYWVYPTTGNIAQIVGCSQTASIYGLYNLRPYIKVYQNSTYFATSTININEWNHVAFTLDLDSKAAIYINGELSTDFPVAAITANTSSANAKMLIGENLYGNLDELRIWKYAKTADEIKRDYNRFMTGNEENLLLYWRFDENQGDNVYDVSYTGVDYHKNHGTIVSGSVIWSSEVPSLNQLNYAGITDENGNYKISGLKYSGNGSTFNFSPQLGTHRFDPTDIDLYIGDVTPVHNQINFTDKSSFVFRGRITYENTNFPVEGANIYIDGQQVIGEGNTAVKTDMYGEFEISVPIGDHYISVEKPGHTFANNGQWPKPTEDEAYPKFYFIEDMETTIQFYDLTKVTVAGRFVGGDKEGKLPVGFHKSKNNIGQGTIVLSNEQGYDIDLTSSENNTISYKTNAESGEYIFELLPEKYIIESVKVDNSTEYAMTTDDLTPFDLRNIPSQTTEYDTTYTDDTKTEIAEIDSVTYHLKRNFIYYAQPTIHVTTDGENEFTGDSKLIFDNPETQETDTLDLVKYPFKYDVFTMGQRYNVQIAVYEEYTNADNNELYLSPVENADITIKNSLERETPTYTYKTNKAGLITEYNSFIGGEPNLSKDEANGTSFTKLFEVFATTPKFNVMWEPGGEPYRAYVLGQIQTDGADFVTYGPEIPSIVLRDPPGSRSYAYIEKGSKFSIANSWEINKGGKTGYDVNLSWGQTSALLPFGSLIQLEYISDDNAGVEFSYTQNENGELVKTFTFTERFSTSSDPTGVGAMADVFIGEAKNAYFFETENLRVMPKNFAADNGLTQLGDTEVTSNSSSEHTLAINNAYVALPEVEETMFIYTQSHIINHLIPELLEQRNNLFVNKPDVYESKLASDHEYYGLDNDNPVFDVWGEKNPSYVYHADLDDGAEIYDKVAFYNQQIGIWFNVIATNEAVKANAPVDKNISFDGNAGEYLSEISYARSYFENKEVSRNFELHYNSEFGLQINDKGFTMESHSSYNKGITIGQSDTKEHSISIGYVLDDGDHGDYFSVDILQPDGGLSFSSPYFLGYNDTNVGESGGMDIGFLVGSIGIAGGSKVAKLVTKSLFKKSMFSAASLTTSLAFSIIQYSVHMSKMSKFQNKITGNIAPLEFEGPVFRIMGGQSKCPYEGPDYSLFYAPNGKPAQLQVGTQPAEVPNIEIEPFIRSNVPETEKAYFDLKLTNKSSTGQSVTFEIQVDENSNPDGAEIRIDGLEPNRAFFMPAGETVTKTMTVAKGKPDVMDYENLNLIFHSMCQYDPNDDFDDLADTVTFSVHFQPACTNIAFKELDNNWIVNKADNDTLWLTLQDYDINHASFERIALQYRIPGGNEITAMNFYNSETAYNDDTGTQKELINGEATINYAFDMRTMPDGVYEIRAKSICTDGSVYATPFYPGEIDGIAPHPFGSPSPADGILEVEDEIMVQFNEEINSGDLYLHKDYISVKGVKNGTDLRNFDYVLHDANLYFDGAGQKMFVPAGVNLKYTDFTIEFWLQRATTGAEIILTHGNPENGGLEIGFDANNYLYVSMNGETFTSTDAFGAITGKWVHFATTFDIENAQTDIGLYLSTSNNNYEYYFSTPNTYFGEGSLSVGYNDEKASGFNGNMHELRIWNTARLTTELNATRYQLLNGKEAGLLSCWKMDDAHGSWAEDIAGYRHGEITGTWQVSRNGKSANLNNGYLTFGSGQMVFDEEEEFTVEFWLKAATPATDACIFSNGAGDDSDASETDFAMIAKANGAIELWNNGTVNELISSGVLDNTWHHVAMSVNRLGYVNFYVDGVLKQSIRSSNLTGFAGGVVAFGSRIWVNGLSQTQTDMPLNALVDDIRFWNTARSEALINSYMNHSLNGSETGIMAYFPFEDVSIADPSTSNSSLLNFSTTEYGTADNATFNGSATYSTDAAKLKLQKPLTDIKFEYSINNDKLLISLTEDASLIENIVAEIAVKGVKDMKNNVLESTVNWTAYIDRNAVVWEKESVTLNTMPDVPLTFAVNVINKGGSEEQFTIENIPNWLTCSKTSGLLAPDSQTEINFAVIDAVNVGDYVGEVLLNSSMGFNEKLTVNLSVRNAPPLWTVNPSDFEYSMSIIGKVFIADNLSTDPNDLVGVFAGEECRGVANIKHYPDFGLYLVYVQAYSNETTETGLTFKVWDSDKGIVYSDVTPVFDFEANRISGTSSAPIEIRTTSDISADIPVATGWNWVSFNLESTNLSDLNVALSSLTPAENSLIKNQLYFDMYSADLGWYGSLSNSGGLNVSDMYMLHLSGNDTIVYSGAPVQTLDYEITLHPNWTWFGFTANSKMTLNNAFAYLTPEQNDVVKSQFGFAMYDEMMGWLGSLTYLQAGEGYKYHSKALVNKTFKFPQESLMKSGIIEEKAPNDYFRKWKSNMNIICALDGNMGTIPPNSKIDVYSNDVLCGSSEPLQNSNGNGLYFVTIYGNSTKDLTFHLTNESGQTITTFDNQVSYQADKLVGTLANPYILQNSVTGIAQQSDFENTIRCMPNPFTNRLTLVGNALKNTTITITDITGRIIKTWNCHSNTTVWNGETDKGNMAASGIYFISIEKDFVKRSFKIVKK